MWIVSERTASEAGDAGSAVVDPFDNPSADAGAPNVEVNTLRSNDVGIS